MSYGAANRYRSRVHCIDCGKLIDRQAYRCRTCARIELIAFKAHWPKPVRSSRRSICADCGKERYIEASRVCKTCLRRRHEALDIPDGESPCRLTRSGWTKHGLIWRHDGSVA